jgi:hypothetical protein
MIFLLLNNNFSEYGTFIGCGLILGYSVYFLLNRNNTANLPNKTEAFTNQEIEAILNENAAENAVAVINDENIDAIIDIDSEIDFSSDTQSTFYNDSLFDSDSSSDFNVLDDPEIIFLPYVKSLYSSEPFIMPDVDFDVCPIEELKLFEISSLFSKEMAEHSFSEQDLIELLAIFPKEDLATN